MRRNYTTSHGNPDCATAGRCDSVRSRLPVAQVQLPDTPAAHQLSAWLVAFDSGDWAMLLAFLQKNFPARAAEIDDEMGFREQTGGFDRKKAGDCGVTKYMAILQERDSDQFGRIVVDVDPGPALLRFLFATSRKSNSTRL